MLDRTLKLARAVYDAAMAKTKTGPQRVADNGDLGEWIGYMMSGECNGGSMWSKAPAGKIETWRKMRRNPTIALALAASKAPVKAAHWSVEADDGVPEERLALIRDYVLPLRPVILGDGLRAIEYGYQPFEVVWMLEGGRTVPAKLKPLLPEKTKILEDKQTGAFTGLENGDVTLDPHDSLVVSFDGEAGSLKGESRLENIREDAWWPWKQTLIRVSQYTTKAAGIIPRIGYPIGESTVAGGNKVSNTVIAQTIAKQIERGGSIIMPNKIPEWATDLVRQGVGLEKLMAWNIEFIEARNAHGTELSAMMDKFEALMVRGLLTPERSILQGQHGTNAESETQGDVGIAISQDTSEQLMRIVNWHLVDKVLIENYGPEAAGTVRICAAPLVDEQAALLREIMKAVLTAPGNIDLLAGMLDLESSMEEVGLTVRKDAVYPDPSGADNPADPGNANDPSSVVASIFSAARRSRSEPTLSLDCGTGYGGFKPGNNCASGGSGGGDKGASPRTTGATGDLVDTWARQQGDSTRYTAVRNEGIAHFRDGKKSDQWESVYQDTQAKMSHDGISEVRAFRGVRLPSDHPLIEAIRAGKIKAGQTVSIDGMELNSFSEKLTEAQRFASPYKDSQHGVVFERVIPARDVVASHRYQKSFYSNEGEVIAKNAGKMKLRIIGTVVDDKTVGISLSAGGKDDQSFDLTETDDQRGIGEPGE